MAHAHKFEVKCDRCGKIELVDSSSYTDKPKWPPKWDHLHNQGSMKGKWPKDLCGECVEALYVFMAGPKN